MPLLLRNITRAILNTGEITDSTSTPVADTAPLVLLTTDKLYIGYKQRFASRFLGMGVANTNSATLTVKYWDGTAYTEVEDLCDQSKGMTVDGFISWVNKSNWNKKTQAPVNDIELYWVEITTSADFSVGTTIQAVLNLYSDDSSVRRFYSELISDPRWLPVGRTDFLEQHEQAKDMIVLRLKQDGLITEEGQIIDPNEVANAAAHAAAYLIVNGVATDEDERDRANAIFRSFTRELNRVKLDIDLDKSGIIEGDEQNEGNFFIPRGGF